LGRVGLPTDFLGKLVTDQDLMERGGRRGMRMALRQDLLPEVCLFRESAYLGKVGKPHVMT